MYAISGLGRAAAAGSARLGSVATVPLRVLAAMLDSPRLARQDPSSNGLAALRHDGWQVSEVRLGGRKTSVDVERQGQRETVEGTSLAFAAYATRVGVAAGAAVVHDPHR